MKENIEKLEEGIKDINENLNSTEEEEPEEDGETISIVDGE